MYNIQDTDNFKQFLFCCEHFSWDSWYSRTLYEYRPKNNRQQVLNIGELISVLCTLTISINHFIIMNVFGAGLGGLEVCKISKNFVKIITISHYVCDEIHPDTDYFIIYFLVNNVLEIFINIVLDISTRMNSSPYWLNIIQQFLNKSIHSLNYSPTFISWKREMMSRELFQNVIFFCLCPKMCPWPLLTYPFRVQFEKERRASCHLVSCIQ